MTGLRSALACLLLVPAVLVAVPACAQAGTVSPVGRRAHDVAQTGGDVAPLPGPWYRAPAGTPAPVDPAAPVEVASGRTLLPASYGAVGDGRADDTAALQRALDALLPGDTLSLRAGAVYRHTDVLRIRVASVRVTGSAVLLATQETRSSVFVLADDVTLDGGLVLRTTGTTRRWDAYEQTGLRLAGTRGTVVRGVRVEGSAAAGIYVGGASGFLLEDVRVRDTRADGIHLTEGAHDGRLVRPYVERSGDDAIAVVSYDRGALAHHLTVEHPVVRTTTWGRGLAVVGGEDITFTDVDVDRSSAAAVYLSNEGAPYYTRSTRRVRVLGGRTTHANTDAGVGHGAVLLYSAQAGHVVEDVTVSGLEVADTTATAPRSVGAVVGAGTVVRASFSAVTLVRGVHGWGGNAPRTSYRTVGWTWDGVALPDRLGW